MQYSARYGTCTQSVFVCDRFTNTMRALLHFLVNVMLYEIITSTPVPGRSSPPSSPCPSVFYYERQIFNASSWVFPSNHNRLWKGVVMVSPSIPIFLKVQIAVPGTLPSNFVGRLELATDKETVLTDVEFETGEQIKYYVLFPAGVSLPHLLLVEVNSKILCSVTPAPKRVQTKITLQHALYYPAGGGVRGRSPIFDEDIRSTSSVCGTAAVKNPLVIRGSTAARGAWPWIVPLFRKTTLGLEFLCSGSLISKQHIVTAAHCVQYKDGEDIRSTDIVAYVGRYDIGNWTEEGSQPREVQEILVHPDYDPHTLGSDLALLKLKRMVNLTERVQVVCMWTGDTNLDLIVGHEAVVLGWGMDELGNKVTRIPRTAVMPIVSQETCLRSRKDFVFLTSNRTLCAGLRNGTGPCNGDSGGGLFVSRRTRGGPPKWYIRGVISMSLLNPLTHQCNLNEFTIFTDVAKYQDWLNFMLL